jgi:NADPH2 dehydrogenase
MTAFLGMRMADPIPTYTRFVEEIRDRFPSLAYLHLVEPRFEGAEDVVPESETDSNDFLREIWKPKPFISAGGYTRSGGIERAESTGDLIAYGRYFIANVRLLLPCWIEQRLPINIVA